MSDRLLPTRTSTLVAGGGQTSGIADHQSVRTFSPLLALQLQRLYRSLASGEEHQDTDGDNPPLNSYDQFLAWFHSSTSSALAPPVNHDLSLPLCNYYISSSHNTYLSGNQLYGTASTEAYKNVLLRGCRCLEIDVWNGADESSSGSSSDHEDAHHHEKKADASHRERALSKFKSLKGRFGHDKDATRIRSHSPPPESKAAVQEREENEDNALSRQMTTLEIRERRAMLRHEPRVMHGHTLTKDVPFREVCEAIRDSAFKASTLPIIVSLEVHCNVDQQKVMVEIMEETWKGYLVDMSNRTFDSVEQLPSPDALRNKILIKVKWTSSTNTGGKTNNPLEISRTVTSESVTTVRSAGSEHQHAQKQKAAKILDALSRLGVYTRAYSFKQFSQPEAKIPTHVFSLDENKLSHLHADPQNGPDMFNHNRNFLVRIYPSGLRVNSSNIDPTFGWRQGAQMVALNWQKLDMGMMLNEGMFAGEEGYVLKPDGFRSSHIPSQAPPSRKRLNLTIRLAAAQNLPLPIDRLPSHGAHVKPYVKFILHVDTHGPPGQGKKDRSDSTANSKSRFEFHKGHEANEDDDDDEGKDEAERKLKHRSKNGKTNTTNFDGPDMTWTDVPDVVEQLTFLRIKVSDDKPLARDDLLAWACIRLDRLKTGWRLLHLLDVEGKASEGVLLVHIEKKFH